jgi:hypothetical protein
LFSDLKKENLDINIFLLNRIGAHPHIFVLPFKENDNRVEKSNVFLNCKNIVYHKLDNEVNLGNFYRPGIYYTYISNDYQCEVDRQEVSGDTKFIESKLLNKALEISFNDRLVENKIGSGIAIEIDRELKNNSPLYEKLKLRTILGAYVWHQTLGNYERDKIQQLEIGVSIYPFYSVSFDRRISSLLEVGILNSELIGVNVICNKSEMISQKGVKGVIKDVKNNKVIIVHENQELEYNTNECKIIPHYKSSRELLMKIDEYRNCYEWVNNNSKSLNNAEAFNLSKEIAKKLNEIFYSKISLGSAQYKLSMV